jgi:predicted acylesterase/phospholipase RssA
VVGILTILARLTELGGSSRSTEKPDVLVRPDVERFPMLDFGRFDELVEQGHRQALQTLPEWWGARAT